MKPIKMGSPQRRQHMIVRKDGLEQQGWPWNIWDAWDVAWLDK